MSKIKHAHHAEYERQSAGQQEQQHAVKQAVQTGKDNKFEHGAVASVSGIDGCGGGRDPQSSGSPPRSAGTDDDNQVGAFIWQVVGMTVSAAGIVPTVLQPQPVFSSSSFVPEPNEAMYMSWNTE